MSVKQDVATRREAQEIVAELRACSKNAWIGTPGWHFDRILDRLQTAKRITGEERINGLVAEVRTMRLALLELLPRIEGVLGEAADAGERQYAAMAAR